MILTIRPATLFLLYLLYIPLTTNAKSFVSKGQIENIYNEQLILNELKDSLNRIYNECIKISSRSPMLKDLKSRHDTWIKGHETTPTSFEDGITDWTVKDEIDAYIEECSFFLNLFNKKLLNYFLDKVYKNPSKYTSTFILMLFYIMITSTYGECCNFAWEFITYSSAITIDRNIFLVACVECMGAYAASYSLYTINRGEQEFVVNIFSLEEPVNHAIIYNQKLFEQNEKRNALHGNLGLRIEDKKFLICWNSRERGDISNKTCVWEFDKNTETGKVFYEEWNPITDEDLENFEMAYTE